MRSIYPKLDLSEVDDVEVFTMFFDLREVVCLSPLPFWGFNFVCFVFKRGEGGGMKRFGKYFM